MNKSNLYKTSMSIWNSRSTINYGKTKSIGVNRRITLELKRGILRRQKALLLHVLPYRSLYLLPHPIFPSLEHCRNSLKNIETKMDKTASQCKLYLYHRQGVVRHQNSLHVNTLNILSIFAFLPI